MGFVQCFIAFRGFRLYLAGLLLFRASELVFILLFILAELFKFDSSRERRHSFLTVPAPEELG